MNTEITVHITYDDLSEECRRKIEKLKGQGTTVRINWPLNDYYVDPINSQFVQPSIQPTIPIPIQPMKTDDIDWSPSAGDTTVYCKADSSSNSRLKLNSLGSIKE